MRSFKILTDPPAPAPGFDFDEGLEECWAELYRWPELEGWTIEESPRATRQAGFCDYSTKTIRISRPIFENVEKVKSAEDAADAMRDTFLHELAHALVGPGHGHGSRWKAMARDLGATPERCHSLPRPSGKYHGVCSNGCGAKPRVKDRMSAAMRQGRHYHKPCGARIDWIEVATGRWVVDGEAAWRDYTEAHERSMA